MSSLPSCNLAQEQAMPLSDDWLKTEGRQQRWSSSAAVTPTPAHKVHEACIVPEVLHTPGFKILCSLIQNGHWLNKLAHLMKLFQDDNVTSILKFCPYSCPLVFSAAPDRGLSQLSSGVANWEKCLASSNGAVLGLERKCRFWKLSRLTLRAKVCAPRKRFMWESITAWRIAVSAPTPMALVVYLTIHSDNIQLLSYLAAPYCCPFHNQWMKHWSFQNQIVEIN